MLTEIRQTAAGAAILAEWLGEGGEPVQREDAERRAFICQYCPDNVAPKWWEWAKDAIAEAIKKHLAVKESAGLEVSNEGEIHVCKICGCCLPLKVWTPIDHISRHTDQTTYDKYPRPCWVRKEIYDYHKHTPL